ncbi:MAG TPA: S8 family serine peptidase [Saprospiraceae bacterium]|nr:S8 family serine peptidase [Saprospiraceae bacterium]
MYKYKLGGKTGKTFTLQESTDLVAVRTRGAKSLEDSELSAKARDLLPRMLQIASLPEANVTIYKCLPEDVKNKKKLRDDIRAQFTSEKAVRFAGRVLEDKESGNIFIYTENFFVKFKDDVPKTRCREILKDFELKISSELKFAKNAFFTKAKDDTGLEIFTIADQLLKKKEVEYCHPELVQERRSKFIHPMQWHLFKTTVKGNMVDQHVGIEEAWKISTGKNVVVAVIDDGVDMDHEEFAGKEKIVSPRDAMLDSDNARPKHYSDRHGTACAGVVCANGKNYAAGVAPDAKLMPIRTGNLGSISEANAFAWAADHGADVISCSWGPSDGFWGNPNDPLHSTFAPLFDSTRLAIDYAIEHGRNGKGCVITWAAGNGNENVVFDGYASYEKVIAVAACNDQGKRSVYSDFGDAIWCCFPSNDFEFPSFSHPRPLTDGIWTTDRRGSSGYNPGGSSTPITVGDIKGHYTAVFGGTSSACPGAAGISALILSINPELAWTQVRDILRSCCDKIDQTGGNYNANGHSTFYGYGRLNATRAVEMAKSTISTQPDVNLSGVAHFTKYGNVVFTDNAPAGGFKSGNKLSGLSIKIEPFHPELGISYSVRFNKLSKAVRGTDGSFAGVNDKRRKAVGISFILTGKLASKYTIRYAGRTRKNGPWKEESDGGWCGKNTSPGEGIREIRCEVKPR